jgi:hypothetical protein
MNLFNAFYNSFYGLACIVLFGLLLITPSDTIRQALSNNQLYNVFVIAGAFVLTLIFIILIITQRLYTNTSVLKAIPKTWIPVEKGDVNKKVRKMIVASLTRSAIIAWEAKPRTSGPQQAPAIISEPGTRDPVKQPSTFKSESKEKEGLLRRARSQIDRDDHVVIVPHQHEWDDITHSGWSSPSSPDLPNLQYSTVILELPHLIEARAVSLAPPGSQSPTGPALPDIRVVDILHRPAAMGLREYIGYLSSVGVIASLATVTDFLASYEYARFSGQPLKEQEFRNLMQLFADLLRGMHGLSPAILASLDIDPSESDIDEDGSTTSSISHRSRSLTSLRTSSIHSGSEGTIRTAPSRNAKRSASKKGREKFSIAPATPRSKKRLIAKSPSLSSFTQSKQPYNVASDSSSSSIRSGSQNSVIKLSRANEDGELPYTLLIPGMR